MGIELLPEIWPDWQVVEQIGEGAFGKVYKAVRQDAEFTTYAAIKVITVPKTESEIESLQAEGMNDDSARSYFQGIVSDFINEIKLMETMKGTSNIVSVEDYKVIEKKNGIGWDIFIRMEFLTPLVKYLSANPFSENDVIKLGIDICSALELCAQRNIIHRDIKPENIFVSSFGNFKIGDFGIAKQLEKTNSALSSKGTFVYMAPEVVANKKYDSTVDIYSLGIVLYKLLNNNRLPFIDPRAEQLTYFDRKLAVDRRLSGEKLPAPVKASDKVAKIILTACAYNPAERFVSPTAMKNALSRQLSDAPVVPIHLQGGKSTEQARSDHTGYKISDVSGGNNQKADVKPSVAVPSSQDNSLNNSRNNTGTQTFNNTGLQNRTYTPDNNNKNKSNNDSSNKGILLIMVLVAVIAIAVIVIAYSVSAIDENAAGGMGALETTSVQKVFDVTQPDFCYTEPIYRLVDVDDQYGSDPLEIRTGPGKDGTEKITEITDGSYIYVYGGTNSTDDWVYVQFEGNYGWMLSKYLHEA